MDCDLVLDIGNFKVKGGLFQGKELVDAFTFGSSSASHDDLKGHLEGKSIKNVLVSSVNQTAEKVVASSLEQQKIAYAFLDYKKLKLILDVDEPEQLGHDRIADAYGALTRFPINDCIVVDIGTAITADFVAKEGKYLGGMIYPGFALCAKALATYTDKLPLVSFKKPSSALARTTQTHLQGGMYYGQLGAIERMIDELKLTSVSPSSVKVIATGGATHSGSDADSDQLQFIDDLKELVDLIDPHLTLLGLHEILIELTNKE